MKVQKISITKTVNKCLLLIDQFKSEQKYVNSPLIKQTANDFDITHRKLINWSIEGARRNYAKVHDTERTSSL